MHTSMVIIEGWCPSSRRCIRVCVWEIGNLYEDVFLDGIVLLVKGVMPTMLSGICLIGVLPPCNTSAVLEYVVTL